VARDAAPCAHVILQDGLCEVADAWLDPCFADSPLVVGEPHIRFYAGWPLCLADGARVGTLCVMDHRPRRLDAMQREVLAQLATAAARALEGRRALRVQRRLCEQAVHAAAVLHNSLDAIVSLRLDGTVTHWSAAAARLFGHEPAQMCGQLIARIVPPDASTSTATSPRCWRAIPRACATTPSHAGGRDAGRRHRLLRGQGKQPQPRAPVARQRRDAVHAQRRDAAGGPVGAGAG
jgi:PAS domain-containing protein